MMQTFVRPSRDLRNHYAEISEMLKDHDHVIITNHGRGESVLINIEDYAKYEEFCTSDMLQEALAKAKQQVMADPDTQWADHESVWETLGDSMTYKIKYLPLAVQDLNDIARYLSGFYPKQPAVLKELREKITKLAMPRKCEVYRPDPAYRRMVVDQYLVFYRINDEIKSVEVHRVLRGAWNLPQYLE
ncbi:MAG: type II toxin-antitoxin system RelE/ParE family toxin [Anaeromassilibacillus sp.]